MRSCQGNCCGIRSLTQYVFVILGQNKWLLLDWNRSMGSICPAWPLYSRMGSHRAILVNGYLGFGLFPIVLSYFFVNYCLYREVDEEELIKCFLKYLKIPFIRWTFCYWGSIEVWIRRCLFLRWVCWDNGATWVSLLGHQK